MVLLIAIETSISPHHQLLTHLRLLALREGRISLNLTDLSDKVVGGAAGSSSRREVEGERGTVGAFPLESGGDSLGTGGEAVEVPGCGTGFAGEVVFVGGLDLAEHANTVTVAGQLANLRHGRE